MKKRIILSRRLLAFLIFTAAFLELVGSPMPKESAKVHKAKNVEHPPTPDAHRDRSGKVSTKDQEGRSLGISTDDLATVTVEDNHEDASATPLDNTIANTESDHSETPEAPVQKPSSAAVAPPQKPSSGVEAPPQKPSSAAEAPPQKPSSAAEAPPQKPSSAAEAPPSPPISESHDQATNVSPEPAVQGRWFDLDDDEWGPEVIPKKTDPPKTTEAPNTQPEHADDPPEKPTGQAGRTIEAEPAATPVEDNAHGEHPSSPSEESVPPSPEDPPLHSDEPQSSPPEKPPTNPPPASKEPPVRKEPPLSPPQKSSPNPSPVPDPTMPNPQKSSPNPSPIPDPTIPNPQKYPSPKGHPQLPFPLPPSPSINLPISGNFVTPEGEGFPFAGHVIASVRMKNLLSPTQLPPPANNIPDQPESSSSDCPSLDDFLKGSPKFCPDLTSSVGWKKGVGIPKDTLTLSLKALSYCLLKINSEISSAIRAAKTNAALMLNQEMNQRKNLTTNFETLIKTPSKIQG